MDSKAPTQAILDALAARLAELEAAHAQQRERTASLERDNARLREEMVTLRAGG
jgi:predicted nuclease with TOPRIM domain